MQKAEPQYWRKWALSWDPEDVNDPANAPYLYEAPDGTKFVDWYNPNHSLEKWADKTAEKLAVLATGDRDEIEKYYRDEYYRLLVEKREIGPDYHEGGSNIA